VNSGNSAFIPAVLSTERKGNHRVSNQVDKKGGGTVKFF